MSMIRVTSIEIMYLNKSKFLISISLIIILSCLLLPYFIGDALALGDKLGAFLYISPLSRNPKVASNFTMTIKTDSLAEPINAISGELAYNPDKLEIITTSKVGSIFNLWLEEPVFSNQDGTIKFQGGVPNPGFIGNGGTVLNIIFKAKTPGVASVTWQKAEVLAHDGKGTNILTSLENSNFTIEDDNLGNGPPVTNPSNALVVSNIVLSSVVVIGALYFLARRLINSHEMEHLEMEHELHKHDKGYHKK